MLVWDRMQYPHNYVWSAINPVQTPRQGPEAEVLQQVRELGREGVLAVQPFGPQLTQLIQILYLI